MGAWHTEHTNAAARSAWSELLPRWDELSTEALGALENDPVHGPELRMLQRAENWLHDRCAPETACPSAEELYDHGRGPGAQTLSDERRDSIAQHLTACADCEALTLTLDLRPPLPLDLTMDEPLETSERVMPAAFAPEPEIPAAASETPILTHPRWRRNVQRLAPAAAAASLLAMALLVTHDSTPSFAANGVPSAPLLRGEANGPLLFPRGPVLAHAGFDRSPTFEIAEQAGASEYRVVLRRHDGGAFAQGEMVLSIESSDRIVRADLTLAPGHYTWEAWAVVDGLDHSLGSRDFEVVEDAKVLERVDRTSGPERVRLLHAAGFPTDARHLTWTLPESEFRSEYLRLIPGR